MSERASPTSRPPWSLVLWIAAAIALFIVTPGPPERPVQSEEDAAAAQRAVEIAYARAREWDAEHGDERIAWGDARGHLAIVIDDVGRELYHFEQLYALPYELTFSVLPGSVYAPGVQLRLTSDHRRPREVMLHLPMEPSDPAQMQEGLEAQETFLLHTDSPAVLRDKVRAALQRVPMARVVNNHMGSSLTRDEIAMTAVMTELAAQQRVFLDSRTIGDTVAQSRAEALGISAGAREIFLDHDPSVAAIEAALDEAAKLAVDHPVVAIGHPSDAMVEVLRRRLPALHADGIGIFPVSTVLMRSRARPSAVAG